MSKGKKEKDIGAMTTNEIIGKMVTGIDQSYEMQRLVKARTGLIMASPFFGTLALNLKLAIDEKSEAAFWTDGTTVGVRPEIVRDLPMGELEAILARATINAALGHPYRREGREPKRWGEACAHVAGLEVALAGMTLPAGSPAAPAFKGMSAPQVYAELQPPPSDSGGDQGGAGASDPAGSPQSAPGGSQGDQDPSDPAQSPSEPPSGSQDDSQGDQGSSDPGSQPGNAAPQQSQAGAGAGGPPMPDPGSGEIRDAQGDAAEREEQANNWQVAVAQAAQVARAQGKLPGDLERAAMEVVNARVSWREALMRFFKSRAKDDHTWNRPNHRMLGTGFYFPARSSIRMGPIAIAIDLSGSIGQAEVDMFLAEMQAIRNECKPEKFILLPFDTRVVETIEIEEHDDLEFKTKAGGGTDFKPAVEALAEMGVEPEALVYLTDLDCSSFPDEPGYPVLWATTRKEHAPFGEVILMQ